MTGGRELTLDEKLVQAKEITQRVASGDEDVSDDEIKFALEVMHDNNANVGRTTKKPAAKKKAAPVPISIEDL